MCPFYSCINYDTSELEESLEHRRNMVLGALPFFLLVPCPCLPSHAAALLHLVCTLLTLFLVLPRHHTQYDRSQPWPPGASVIALNNACNNIEIIQGAFLGGFSTLSPKQFSPLISNLYRSSLKASYLDAELKMKDSFLLKLLTFT